MFHKLFAWQNPETRRSAFGTVYHLTLSLSLSAFSFLIWFASSSDMRRDVQEIFRATPHHKQVMMFSATLAKEIRATCKKFMANVRLYSSSHSTMSHSCEFQPLEIFVDDETKLTLHGLQQHYIKLEEAQKNRKLNELLDTLEFNQVSFPVRSLTLKLISHAKVVIFVKSVARCIELDKLLVSCNFPSISIHSGLQQQER